MREQKNIMEQKINKINKKSKQFIMRVVFWFFFYLIYLFIYLSPPLPLALFNLFNGFCCFSLHCTCTTPEPKGSYQG